MFGTITNSFNIQLSEIKKEIKNLNLNNKEPIKNEGITNSRKQDHTHSIEERNSSPLEDKDIIEVTKLLTPTNDWPKFNGEGECDHISFIRYMDHTLDAYNLPEKVLLIRLPRLFEGVALDWFITKRDSVGHQNWTFWKKAINEQFGTQLWRKRMIKLFENDFFDPVKDQANKWCLLQKKRLECAYPHLNQEEIN